MAAISETHASLRFYGDDLCPDDLTARLGGTPSSSARKGDVMPSGHVVKTGRWILRVDQRTPGNLDAQIKEIFSNLTPDLAVWAELTATYRSDLFLGLMLSLTNEGIELGVESIALLAKRNISVGLDIYAPRETAHSEAT
jgi:Domain of unknown function (DUF4279)